jgi:hypothetical protein
MNSDPDLKTLERKAFRSYFHDGILEIFIGVLFLCMVAGDILDVIGSSYRWTYPAIAAAVLASVAAKKRLTGPRAGRVVFDGKRKANRRKLLTLLILTQVLTLAVLAVVWTGQGSSGPVSGWGAIARQMAAGFFFFTVPFCAMAWFLENPVMLIPAFFGFFKEAFHGLLPKPWIALLTAGVGGWILILTGAVLLVRFLRNNPKPETEENHDLRRNARSGP